MKDLQEYIDYGFDWFAENYSCSTSEHQRMMDEYISSYVNDMVFSGDFFEELNEEEKNEVIKNIVNLWRFL